MIEVNKTPSGLSSIKFLGDLTIYVAADAKIMLLEAVNESDGIEIDMSMVSELDSAGVQLLLATEKLCSATGRYFSIKNISPPVKDIFTLLMAIRLIEAIVS